MPPRPGPARTSCWHASRSSPPTCASRPSRSLYRASGCDGLPGPEGRILRAVLGYECGRFDERDVTGPGDMHHDAVEWATETVLKLGCP